MGDQPLPLGLLQTVRQAEVHLGLAAILRDAGYVENVVGECQVPIGGDAEIAHLDLVRPRILREEFLKPMELTPYKVAKACGVPRTRIERIVREELGITADTALRLAKFFGTTVGFWMNLQTRYDIRMAERAIAADLAAIQTFKRQAA